MQNAHIAALFKLHGKPFGRDILRRKIQLRKSGEIERFNLDIEETSSRNENENGENENENGENENEYWKSERVENEILVEHEEVIEGRPV
jgi:hypothetical protein